MLKPWAHLFIILNQSNSLKNYFDTYPQRIQQEGFIATPPLPPPTPPQPLPHPSPTATICFKTMFFYYYYLDQNTCQLFGLMNPGYLYAHFDPPPKKKIAISHGLHFSGMRPSRVDDPRVCHLFIHSFMRFISVSWEFNVISRVQHFVCQQVNKEL